MSLCSYRVDLVPLLYSVKFAPSALRELKCPIFGCVDGCNSLLRETSSWHPPLLTYMKHDSSAVSERNLIRLERTVSTIRVTTAQSRGIHLHRMGYSYDQCIRCMDTVGDTVVATQ
jgi:hypothetical protein